MIKHNLKKSATITKRELVEYIDTNRYEIPLDHVGMKETRALS
jgi:hypothetical protein